MLEGPLAVGTLPGAREAQGCTRPAGYAVVALGFAGETTVACSVRSATRQLVCLDVQLEDVTVQSTRNDLMSMVDRSLSPTAEYAVTLGA